MKWQVKFEPSAEAREFRWIRSYDIKFLVFSAIAVVLFNVGLLLYTQVWKDRPQDVRITVQDPEGAVLTSESRKSTQPGRPSSSHPKDNTMSTD